jgi:hypothetical protein
VAESSVETVAAGIPVDSLERNQANSTEAVEAVEAAEIVRILPLYLAKQVVAVVVEMEFAAPEILAVVQVPDSEIPVPVVLLLLKLVLLLALYAPKIHLKA